MREHFNPEGLIRNPAFTQAIAVTGPTKTIYIAGQDAVDAVGRVVGATLGEQTAQVLRNVEIAANSAGATLHDVVKWTIYVIDGHPLEECLTAFGAAWGRASNPPAISVVKVLGLVHPEFLVEIEAIAVVDA